jgi:hypothetical protein
MVRLRYLPGMGSVKLTEQAAAEFVRRHGHGALAILAERAELAGELGHRVAAQTWHAMADAAARLLQINGHAVVWPHPPAIARPPAARQRSFTAHHR